MRYYSYQRTPYRGRRVKRPLFIVLAVVLVLLAVFGFFISDYMIFSADGVRFGSSLEDPEPEKTEQNYGEPNLIIEDKTTPDPAPAPDPAAPTDPAEPEPPEAVKLFRLYPADVTRAAEEGYLAGCIDAARADGYEAIALTVRSEEGVLYLPCASRYAEGTADARAEAIAAAVKLAAADFPFAAVLPVCRDGQAPRIFRDQAVKTGGVTWLDYNYISWFDPYLPGAGDYAAALLESCNETGFSAVVLTRMSFPGRGKLELIDSWDRQTATKQETITALAAALADKASGLGLQLSLLLESDQAENVLVTGQSVNDLQQYFSCIYLPQGDPAPLTERYTACAFGLFRAEDGYLPYTTTP